MVLAAAGDAGVRRSAALNGPPRRPCCCAASARDAARPSSACESTGPRRAASGSTLAIALLFSGRWRRRHARRPISGVRASRGRPRRLPRPRPSASASQAITMTGQSRLTPDEVLEIAGISPRNSMPFFDVDAAREPARKDAARSSRRASASSIPARSSSSLVERTPAALWQKNGEIKTISADGAVIDELRDTAFHDLPFVVGDGANERLPEFRALLDATEELRPKIAAGVLVDRRRWNLKIRSGARGQAAGKRRRARRFRRC